MLSDFLTLLACAAAFSAALLIGLAIGVYRLWPFNHLHGIVRAYRAVRESFRNSPLGYNVQIINTLDTPDDILRVRNNLIEFLWRGLPSPFVTGSVKVEHGIVDARARGIRNLAVIDRYSFPMEFGLVSISYHFKALRRNNRLIIYHEGHEGDFFRGKKVIQYFLNAGYDVMAFSMPLKGMNNRPVVSLKRHGAVRLDDHDFFWFVDFEKGGCAVRFFLEPVVAALNYVDTLCYKDYSMIGISGGGWTTTMCAAIDPRIKFSFPVAGSLPIDQRSASELSDYENHIPALYDIANFSELYLLGSHGVNRRQVQILNRYDPVIGGGVRGKYYEKGVQNALAHLGPGCFDVYIDESHYGHKISTTAMQHVLAILSN